MHHLKLYYGLILLLIFVSCKEEYKLDISDTDLDEVTVSGFISDGEAPQAVYISKTSHPNDPRFIPYGGCDVKIEDDKGNEFQLYEVIWENGYHTGRYENYIDQEYRYEGSAFKVNIVTPEGEIITSEFDTLYTCPEIDTIYYELSEILTSDPEYNIKGIQFYIDYNGSNTNAKYIKWNISEAWEYHAKYPKQWVYDNRGLVEYNPPNYNSFRCWADQSVLDVFVLSTQGLVDNKYKRYPLHFVDNTTQRLAYYYSILVKQYALSRQTFEYYKNIQLLINRAGGLYNNTQPFDVEGNLYNITDPHKNIYGFFYAAGMRSKRIFVYPIEGLELEYEYNCAVRKLGANGPGSLYPIYLWYEDSTFYVLTDNCVNCTLNEDLGGNVKPDYWPY